MDDFLLGNSLIYIGGVGNGRQNTRTYALVLALSLFMFLGLANNTNDTLSSDDLTFIADWFD